MNSSITKESSYPVTLVWQKDKRNQGQVLAWFRGKKVTPSQIGASYDGVGYLTRPSYPLEGSAEKCVLHPNEFDGFVAYPTKFISNSMPGVVEPITLIWRKNELGFVRAMVQTINGGERFPVFVGDNRGIGHVQGSNRPTSKWSKDPSNCDSIYCWIIWSISKDGYVVGHAYRVDERTKAYRNVRPHTILSVFI